MRSAHGSSGQCATEGLVNASATVSAGVPVVTCRRRRRRVTHRSMVSTGCTPGITRASSTSQAGVAATPCSRASAIDSSTAAVPTPSPRCSATASSGAPRASPARRSRRGRRCRGRRPSGRGTARRRAPGSAPGARRRTISAVSRARRVLGVRVGAVKSMPSSAHSAAMWSNTRVEPAAGPDRPTLGRDLGVQVVGQVGRR